MNLTYVGDSDFRQIDSSTMPEDVRPEVASTFTWAPGDTVDVPEPMAKWLLEFHRRDFKQPESVGSHQLTRDQLLQKAAEREIVGRSSMTKDELISAIDAHDLAAAEAQPVDASSDAISEGDASGEPEFTQGIPDRGV